MKKVIFVFCIILALVLSMSSFSVAMMQSFNSETETEEALGAFKTFRFKYNDSSVNDYGFFSYREGMTWDDWVHSAYNNFFDGTNCLLVKDGFVYCADVDNDSYKSVYWCEGFYTRDDYDHGRCEEYEIGRPIGGGEIVKADDLVFYPGYYYTG